MMPDNNTVTPKLHLSIVAPVYNEEKSLSRFVEVLLESIEQIEIELLEIIFIDDGSTDGSWNQIQALTQNSEIVKGFRFSRNFGKEAAISAGLQQSSGDAVVVMDCDLQHPPQVISAMVLEWKNGAQIVHGQKEKRQSESKLNRLYAGLYYRVLRLFTGMDLENASDFKLLDRIVVDALNEIEDREPFFRAMNAWIGFETSTVLFMPNDRFAGRTTWTQLRKIRLAIMSIISYSSAPIKLVGITGLIMLFFSLYVVASVLLAVARGTAIEGFATVILLQIFLTTVLMISQGVLAIYVYRIFVEVKRRPRFVIRNSSSRNQND
jgi:glycosyltransferase involved in cell wall biosynthesis